MPDLAQQLTARATREATLVDALNDRFAAELAASLQLLNRRLRREIAILRTDASGRLVSTQANIGRAIRLRDDIITALREAGYGAIVAAATDAPLDRLAAEVLETSRISRQAATLTPVDVDALAALKQVRLAELLSIEDDIEARVWRVLVDGVVGARPMPDLLDDIEDAADVSARQARVIYDTAVSTYQRQVGDLTSQGTDDEVFLYVGPVDGKTREFCLSLVGNVLSRAEIDDLDNGIDGANNVMLTGGGPNCRHRFVRVSVLDTEMRALADTGQRDPFVQRQVNEVRAMKKAA